MADRVYTGDSAVIESELTDDETGEPVAIQTVAYEVYDPFGDPLLVNTLPIDPAAGRRVGLLQNDGGFALGDVVEFNGTDWAKVGDFSPPEVISQSEGFFVFPGALTQTPGLYQGRAQFTTPEGIIKSQRIWFESVDPIDRVPITPTDVAVESAWSKLEDLFDSELGGPWMMDKTLRSFDKYKLAKLLPDALYLINMGYQPHTTFNIDDFPEAHMPLVSQALLVEAIYHLIRTYVEQPLPAGGGGISYFDRRDYLNRWQSVLIAEEKRLMERVDAFKLQYTGFGASAVLVGGYATPVTRMSKHWRLRHPRYIGPWQG